MKLVSQCFIKSIRSETESLNDLETTRLIKSIKLEHYLYPTLSTKDNKSMKLYNLNLSKNINLLLFPFIPT